MNFEKILEHHLMDHRFQSMVVNLPGVGAVDMGLSKHLVMMWIVSGIAVLLLSIAARGKSGAALALRGGVESIVIYLRDDLLHPIFHDATDTYLPYFLSLFFFIFIANLCGLVPYGSAITGNISVTAALSLCTFMLVHFAGVKEQGPIEYVKHICPGGVPWWLMPLIFLIEIMGLVAKCVALSIRLFANILAGHVVSLAFLSLIFIFAQMSKYIGLGVAPAAVGLALFVYTLDLLVSLLQAYIFTFLTALFVGAAVHPH